MFQRRFCHQSGVFFVPLADAAETRGFTPLIYTCPEQRRRNKQTRDMVLSHLLYFVAISRRKETWNADKLFISTRLSSHVHIEQLNSLFHADSTRNSPPPPSVDWMVGPLMVGDPPPPFVNRIYTIIIKKLSELTCGFSRYISLCNTRQIIVKYI